MILIAIDDGSHKYAWSYLVDHGTYAKRSKPVKMIDLLNIQSLVYWTKATCLSFQSPSLIDHHDYSNVNIQ